jgi:hypothetical protein
MNEELKIVREINEHTRKNYDLSIKNDHSNFLMGSRDSFHDFFEAKLRNDYFFSALAVKNKNPASKPFTVVGEGEEGAGYKYASMLSPDRLSNAKKAIINLLATAQDINRSAINVTSLLLEKEEGFDLFFTEKVTDYRDIVNRNVKCFELGELTFHADVSIFCRINAEKIAAFKANFNSLNLSKEFTEDEQYGKYLWHYKNLERIFGRPFYVHFIRPGINYWDYNLLLALATARRLEPEELAFIDLVVYRIVSQTAIEEVKKNEEIAKLQTISSSIHVIKTTVNGLFGPALNSLGQQYPRDARVVELKHAKDTILKYADTINLITKLSINGKNEDMVSTALLQSGFYAELKEPVALRQLFENQIGRARQKGLSQNIKLKIDASEKKDIEHHLFCIFSYKRLYPTRLFFELLALTIIENITEHGAFDRNGNIEAKLQLQGGEIRFMNPAKATVKTSIDPEDMTGIFRVFYIVFSKLGLGSFSAGRDEKNNIFQVTFKSNKQCQPSAESQFF